MTVSVRSIDLRAFDTASGFLGQCFSANHEKYLEAPFLFEEFICLYERKTYTIFRFHPNPVRGKELYGRRWWKD